MIGYLIQMQSADGPPTYYDPAAGRNLGGGMMGWTTEKATALAFATVHDAQKFIDALLPRSASACRPVPHQLGDGIG